MAVREYIQNAADSIDDYYDKTSETSDNCSIIIDVDGKNRNITITDNGNSIPTHLVEERLGSLGFSMKEGTQRRGFRGIGRLGGLAYCDLLRFEARACTKEQVSVVEWDNSKLQSLAENTNEQHTLTETIHKIARISTRLPTEEDSPRFFKVTMVNVHRFHTDVLMNLKALRTTL